MEERSRPEPESVTDMDLTSARIGYVPYDETLRMPGDWRRFCYYAKKRNLTFEIARTSERYDLLMLSAGADLSLWSRYPKRDTKIVHQYINSYLAETRPNPRRMVRGFAKFLFRQNHRLLLDYCSGIRRICEMADAIVCTTLEQKQQVLSYCDNVYVVLDFQDHLIRATKTNYSAGEVFNFVWEGFPENLRFFSEISGLCRKIAKTRKIALHAITDLEYGQYLGRRVWKRHTIEVARKFFDNIYLYSWNEDVLSSIIAVCDLALIPLPLQDPVEMGKPENKLLLFWRLGMPAVVSATPAYSRAMRECGLAMDCRTDQEWEETLLGLLGNEEARRQAGQKGKAFVQKYHGEQTILKQWDTLFSSVLTGKEREAEPASVT